MLGAIAAALRFTRHSPVVKAVIARNALFALFGIAVVSVLPLRVKELGLAATDFGMLMGSYGAGGIFSAFVILPYLRRRINVDTMLLLTAIISTAAIVGIALLRELAPMMVVLFIAGSSWLITVSSFSVAGQQAYPKWVRARSSAVQLIAFQAALGIGGAIWGAVTSQSGTTRALLFAAAGLAVTGILSRFLPIGATQGLDLTPSAHWAPHTLSTEPNADDGPVLVALTYQVAPENEPAFRQAMQLLRLIRLRDGAIRWSLSKSLEVEHTFRESFVVGSWGEHLRQHTRATAADKQIENAALQHAAGPPVIQHFLIVES
jgi:MFS family permease